jgi:hypothetical protein
MFVILPAVTFVNFVKTVKLMSLLVKAFCTIDES